MTSPVETIADALIAFILSLLRDPNASEEFVAAPQSGLAGAGLKDVCAADVAAVKPVIVDHPTVINRPDPPPPPVDPTPANEIVRMIQQFTTIDARSTVVDQSVNQNIWTEGGDVTQLFDQEAVVASGDNAVAAGDDATIVDSDVDVTVGDVAVGNESYEDSFNETGVDAGDDEATMLAETTDVGPEGGDAAATTAGDAVGDAVDTAVDSASAAPAAESTPAPAAPAPAADVPEPADLLEGDMTSGGSESYEADAASTAALDDSSAEDPIEDD